MDSRRLVALASLGLVGTVVVGLIVTGNDGSDDTPRLENEAVDAGPAAAPLPDVAVSSPASSATAPPTEAESTSDNEQAADEAEVTERIPNPLAPDLPNRGQHPPLLEIDGWLQSDVTSLEELRGKVVAVQFWTFGCHNCKATIPHMQALYEKYGGDDFEIVGVHAPEFDFERDPDAVAQAAIDLGVSWPIALDTEKRSFRSWQTDRRFWPRLYLIDQDGNIRYDKIGEGKYDVIDAAVGELIAEGFGDEEFVERNPDQTADPM